MACAQLASGLLKAVQWCESMATGQEVKVDRAAIASEILGYLERHPEAGDTAHGIRIWWLSRMGAGANQSDVEQVLAELVSAGKIAQVNIDPGIEIFRKGGVSPATTRKERDR